MDYSKLYLQKPNDMIIMEESERWSIGFTLSDNDKFEQYSFVNGIMTSKGGKHVDYVSKEIIKKLKIIIEKRTKRSINDSYIKNYIRLFLNSVIENPSFDSQTKERLITPPSKFGSKPIITDKFIKQIIDKTQIIDKVIQFSEFKMTKENKKTDGSKLNKIRNIPKLDDANYAGTKRSEECILILTEGDSAKSMAVAGLSVIGRDKYGVFPLKGKVMNVRDASQEQIIKNTEISNLKKILGLEANKIYKNTKSLRYGKIMIMTDQDHDGSHIKGLVMNVFHSLWPSLLELGYITSMITPIIKITKGKNTKSFYTLTEYNLWQESTSDYKKWSVKYYKGLGTSNSQEAREYFKKLKMNLYHFTEDTNQSMELAFSKIKADERKKWLYAYDESKILNHMEKNIPIEEFIHKELIHFSNSDTFRSIGSVYDGLKPSQRKILYSCLKRNLFKEIRVAQLAGYVSENAAYHHGEASLQGAIIGMAQDYVGSNNINLLMPNGQFGTRIMGGQDAASCRYIHTELNPIIQYLYPLSDFPLLEYNDDDGVFVEPKYYVPIIPMVLINGMVGIGTGFSTSIPQYSVEEIIDIIKMKLLKKGYNKIHPKYRGFQGDIIQIDDKNYMSKGKYNIVNENTIEILELPIGKWTDDYKKYLDSIIYDPKSKQKLFIMDYINNSSDTRVHFTITVPKGFISALQWSEDNADGIEKFLKLTNTKGLSLKNMHLYNQSKIIKYDSIDEIIDEFYKERYILYEKRKEYQSKILLNQLMILKYKIQFITDVIDEKIHIYRKKKNEIIMKLKEYNYPKVKDKKIDNSEDNINGYDYLIKMSLFIFTEEEIEKLKNEKNKIHNEYDKLSNSSIEDLWMNELNKLVQYMKK